MKGVMTSISLVGSMMLSGCLSTELPTLQDNCGASCQVQRRDLEMPSRHSREMLSGVLTGVTLGTIFVPPRNSDDNRAQGAILGGILGAGNGYASGQSVAGNRIEADQLSRELSNELRVQIGNSRQAEIALRTLSRERRARIESGQSAVSSEAVGFRRDLQVAQTSLTALQRQLESSQEFRRALSEKGRSFNSLNNSLVELERQIVSFASTVASSTESLNALIAQSAGCNASEGDKDETRELGDFPLPGCSPSRG